MGYLHLTKHSTAVPGDLFAYATRTDRLTTWLSMMTHLSDADTSLTQVGAAFTADMRLGGQDLTVRWQVTEVRAPWKVRLSGSDAGGGSSDLWLKFAQWDGGTEVRFEIDYELPGGFLASLIDRVFVERAIARDLKHSMGTLIGIVEEHPKLLG